MSEHDVVAALAAHQSNLVPPPVTTPALLMALPTPAIVQVLLGARVAPLRAAWMRAWAERLGGGDGALPIVDLDADARSLGAILRGLGAPRLYLLGARDQPGFARELLARWEGELCLDLAARAPDLQTDLAAPLHDAPAGAGVVQLGGLTLLGLDGDADPGVMAPGLRLYARDPGRLAGALHGFLPPCALFATDAGNRARERWRRYWSARGQADTLREAALGCDVALERRLREPSVAGPPPPPRPRARLFTVTGLDGAGKSSHAAALAATLTASGRSCRIVKLYRQGAFLQLANELSARTRSGALLAAFRGSRIVKLIDSLRVLRDQLQPALDGCDAVVLDRYVETHRAAAAAQLGWDLDAHPLLAPFPRADRTFWLTLDPEQALRRLQARGEALSADEHPVGLAGYAAAFAALRARGDAADLALDAEAPFAANADVIAHAALALLPPPSPQRSLPAPPAASTATAARRDEPLPVDVGGDGAVVLGRDLTELATFLRAEIGAAAEAVPAAFWLEAWAAQLVLDARTTSAPAAVVPLWPEALRRIPAFADLHLLDELARLLEGAVRVARCASSPAAAARAPLWSLIAPCARARAHWIAEYAAAAAAIARERGWPSDDVARPLVRVA